MWAVHFKYFYENSLCIFISLIRAACLVHRVLLDLVNVIISALCNSYKSVISFWICCNIISSRLISDYFWQRMRWSTGCEFLLSLNVICPRDSSFALYRSILKIQRSGDPFIYIWITNNCGTIGIRENYLTYEYSTNYRN